MHLTRWNPRTEPTAQDFIDRFFQRALGSSSYPEDEPTLGSRWTPSTDIRESDDAYEISVDLPGMSKEDVNVTLENNVLTLSGERRFEDTAKKDDFHRIERHYGSFFRSFTLPNRVDSEKVKATFKDGVLHLTVPKTEEVKPRRIAVH